MFFQAPARWWNRALVPYVTAGVYMNASSMNASSKVVDQGTGAARYNRPIYERLLWCKLRTYIANCQAAQTARHRVSLSTARVPHSVDAARASPLIT